MAVSSSSRHRLSLSSSAAEAAWQPSGAAQGVAGGTGDARRVRAGAEVRPHARAAVPVAGHRSRSNVQDQAVAAEWHKSNDERATLELTSSCMVLCVHPLTSVTLEPASCMLPCVRSVAELQLAAPTRKVSCLGPALPSIPCARCAPQAGVWLHAIVHAHCALNTLAGRQRGVSV